MREKHQRGKYMDKVMALKDSAHWRVTPASHPWTPITGHALRLRGVGVLLWSLHPVAFCHCFTFIQEKCSQLGSAIIWYNYPLCLTSPACCVGHYPAMGVTGASSGTHHQGLEFDQGIFRAEDLTVWPYPTLGHCNCIIIEEAVFVASAITPPSFYSHLILWKVQGVVGEMGETSCLSNFTGIESQQGLLKIPLCFLGDNFLGDILASSRSCETRMWWSRETLLFLCTMRMPVKP